jgi:hypothetical protein
MRKTICAVVGTGLVSLACEVRGSTPEECTRLIAYETQK